MPMKTFLLAILYISNLAAVAALVILMWAATAPSEIIQPNPRWAVAPKIVKAAHHYHGIRYSTIDEYGFHYFHRDGQKCKLFTQAFLDSWRPEKHEN